jgi:hypothetical protein
MTSLSKSLHEQVTTLGRFLGKPVFVVEQRLQPEDTCEETTRSASDDGSVQPQGGWEEGRGSANKAPQKFLTPEIGPRASTVAAYDLQGIEAGQQAEGLVQFCPWNVVTSYPMNYIGKTNRPHVCVLRVNSKNGCQG